MQFLDTMYISLSAGGAESKHVHFTLTLAESEFRFVLQSACVNAVGSAPLWRTSLSKGITQT